MSFMFCCERSASTPWVGSSAPGRRVRPQMGPSGARGSLWGQCAPNRSPAGRSWAKEPSQVTGVSPPRPSQHWQDTVGCGGCHLPASLGRQVKEGCWVSATCGVCWGTGAKLRSTIRPSPSPFSTALALVITFLLRGSWNVMNGLPASLLPPQQPAGKYLFQSETPFSATAEKSFYGQWWGSASPGSFQRKQEPLLGVSEFLLSCRGKQQQTGGLSPGGEGSWRAPCAPRGSLQVSWTVMSRLGCDGRVWQTSRYRTGSRERQFLVPLARPHVGVLAPPHRKMPSALLVLLARRRLQRWWETFGQWCVNRGDLPSSFLPSRQRSLRPRITTAVATNHSLPQGDDTWWDEALACLQPLCCFRLVLPQTPGAEE